MKQRSFLGTIWALATEVKFGIKFKNMIFFQCCNPDHHKNQWLILRDAKSSHQVLNILYLGKHQTISPSNVMKRSHKLTKKQIWGKNSYISRNIGTARLPFLIAGAPKHYHRCANGVAKPVYQTRATSSSAPTFRETSDSRKLLYRCGRHKNSLLSNSKREVDWASCSKVSIGMLAHFFIRSKSNKSAVDWIKQWRHSSASNSSSQQARSVIYGWLLRLSLQTPSCKKLFKGHSKFDALLHPSPKPADPAYAGDDEYEEATKKETEQLKWPVGPKQIKHQLEEAEVSSKRPKVVKAMLEAQRERSELLLFASNVDNSDSTVIRYMTSERKALQPLKTIESASSSLETSYSLLSLYCQWKVPFELRESISCPCFIRLFTILLKIGLWVTIYSGTRFLNLSVARKTAIVPGSTCLLSTSSYANNTLLYHSMWLVQPLV